MTKMTTLKALMAAAAVSVVAVSAQAATVVSPTITDGGLSWSFGTLSGDNESDTAIDVATDLPVFIDFFVTPTTGSLAVELNNSADAPRTMAAGQLLCGGGCATGTYTLSYAGTEIFSVVSGAAQGMGEFQVVGGSTESLVWSWDIPTSALRGQVSTNLAPVPVPAAGFLLLGGLGALAAVRRRQKKS
jgi:hypothetical protein